MTPIIHTLYHYTCREAWEQIASDGVLKPNHHPWLDEPLIWLGTNHRPNRRGLGLTRDWITCDRLEVRIPVRCAYTLPWETYANAIKLASWIRKLLEQPPCQPDTWWISTAPIPLERRTIDETWLRVRSGKAKAMGR